MKMKRAYILKIACMSLLLFTGMTLNVYGKEATENSDKVNILYDSQNGMPTSESNDIIQTADGFIWIASYSGVIRYDGDSFVRMDEGNKVSSTNTLFVDSKNNLWIGTNDNGMVLFKEGKYKVYNHKQGLLADSVKKICEDSKGNIYIGTASGVSMLEQKTDKIYNLDSTCIGKSYIKSMDIKDDQIICVTNTGDLFAIKGKNAYAMKQPKGKSGHTVTSVYMNKKADKWYFGTDTNVIYECSGIYDQYKVKELSTGDLKNVNSFYFTSKNDLYFSCDNGAAYYDTKGKLHKVEDLPIDNSIDKVLEDYEGNIWFASSRQGIVKSTKSSFTNISEKAGLEKAVVNAIANYKNDLYIGTDTGIQIIKDNKKQENELTKYTKDVRIRCLMVDKKNQLWISTYGNTGLISYDGKNIKSLNEKNGIHSNKVRSTLELSDGRIYVATANGIDVVKNGKVIKNIGSDQGITNLEVLSMCEASDGTIYAGTDGGGVCLIRNDKVEKTIRQEDGLRSDIIMKIRYDQKKKGYWFVTSNSLEFYKDKKIKTISKFPYSNNFDIYFGDNLWVLSSNGIYAVDEESIFSKSELSYAFYDYNRGMPSTPTANSFSYVDTKNKQMYVCGNEGVYSIDMKAAFEQSKEIKLTIPEVTVDGTTIWEKNGKIVLGKDANRVKIDAYALNYGLDNPLVEYYLEGFDKEKTVVRKSSLSDIIYTNLSGGSYTFHISVINPETMKVVSTAKLEIQKKKSFMELPFYPILLLLVVVGIVVAISNFVIRWRMKQVLLEREKEQKAALSDALKLAEQGSQAKGAFLSKMSHEIRTPLNAIIGYVSMAKDAKDNHDAVEHCLDNCEIASKHLLQIINDVLDMSAIESGKMKIANEDFDLKQVITNISAIFYQNAKKKNLHFETQITELYEEWVVGDQLRLNQVLMNLLSNAEKFTPENGSVKLKVEQLNKKDEKDGSYIKFTVSDTGIGMSKDYMDRLFEPFEQENAGTAKRYGGTGLGLSITNNLVNLMGGSISVDSVQNEGTTFQIVMHFGKSTQVKKQVLKQDNYSHVRVLVVDDEEDDGAYIKKMLKRCGVKAEAVTSGALALKRMEGRQHSEYAYDMCIIDWNMPEMNGIDTVKEIRKRFGEDLPILIATAYDVSELQDEAKKVGVTKVVAKPVFQSMLFDLLVSTFGSYTNDKRINEKQQIDLTGLHVLLVEDNAMNMEIAVNLLEKAKIHVTQATNGQEAYDTFMNADTGAFDLILMDIQMPVMDGYEATKIIRGSSHERAKTIPIVAMTANAFTEDIAEALSYGMNAHIAKPIDNTKLYKVLEDLWKNN